MRCATRGGRINVKSVRGQAILATDGGDIEALQAGGYVNAQTGAGTVHIGVGPTGPWMRPTAAARSWWIRPRDR